MEPKNLQEHSVLIICYSYEHLEAHIKTNKKESLS